MRGLSKVNVTGKAKIPFAFSILDNGALSVVKFESKGFTGEIIKLEPLKPNTIFVIF